MFYIIIQSKHDHRYEMKPFFIYEVELGYKVFHSTSKL